MWKKYKLSELGTVVGGATPSTTVEAYYGGNIPWLTPKDLSAYSDRYITKGERNITDAGLKSCSAKLLPKGSVLFSSRAPIGYIAIANNDIATNQGFKSIIPFNNNDSLFLYYLLEHNKEQIKAMGSGTTFLEVSGAIMKNIEVFVPLLDEQKRIVEVLGSLDDKIELNNKINSNLESQAQALFKRWFVDFEFPDANGNPYKSSGGEFIDSELGGIPKGWKVMELSDVSNLIAGGDKPKVFSLDPNEECNIPIYSNGISKEGLYGYTNTHRIYDESVTVSARGTIGFVCLRLQPYVPIVRLISIVPNPQVLSAKYIYFWIKNININGTGTTQQQLTVPDFKRTNVLIPITTIMQVYTTIIDSIFIKIESIKNENTTLVKLRNTLLPKLMNNEIKI